jgi:hypothetical protein
VNSNVERYHGAVEAVYTVIGKYVICTVYVCVVCIIVISLSLENWDTKIIAGIWD